MLHMWPPQKKHWTYFVINTVSVYPLLPCSGKLFLGSLKVRKVRCQGDSRSTSTCSMFNKATSGVKMLTKKVTSWRWLCHDWTQIFLFPPEQFHQEVQSNNNKKTPTNKPPKPHASKRPWSLTFRFDNTSWSERGEVKPVIQFNRKMSLLSCKLPDLLFSKELC